MIQIILGDNYTEIRQHQGPLKYRQFLQGVRQADSRAHCVDMMNYRRAILSCMFQFFHKKYRIDEWKLS